MARATVTKGRTKKVAPRPARKTPPAPANLKIQERVLKWFVEHGRAFPWREHRDPYKTLVAEVMLQQTQTGRVGPSYQAFVEHFPTISSLAHAPAMDVIKAWKGLGYNRRAVNLQQAAQKIEHDFGGQVPADPRDLRGLPGIGEYSANAIACFAFDVQTPVIDVNVTRTLGRMTVATDQPDPKHIATVARDLLPVGHAYEWNQALMDIGATLCRVEKPLCAKCPMKSSCAYFAKGLHKAPVVARVAKQSKFEGSTRQKRGGIIDALRESAAEGISLGALAKVIHPQGKDRDLVWLVELLDGLERDGLVVLSPGARKASPRGLVRLPS